jgi:serine/threonine protein phosphatase PrpC
MGFSRTGIIIWYNIGRVGSCALSVLVHDNTVYAANIGDCKGVIVKQD